jgi:hypothetical protein
MERLRRGRIESEEQDDMAIEQAEKLWLAKRHNPALADQIDQWRMLLALRRAEFQHRASILVPIAVDDLKTVKDIVYRQIKEDLKTRGIRDGREDELARKHLHNLASEKYHLARQAASAERDARIDENQRATEFLAAKRLAFRRGG